MSIHSQIVKLPAPVLAIIHHEDGRINYNYAATLYQARQEAHRAGATEISDTLWNDLAFHQSESTTYAVAKRSGNRIQSSEEAQNMPVLPQSLALILSCVIICFASVAALNAGQFLYAILLFGAVLIGSRLSAKHLRSGCDLMGLRPNSAAIIGH